MGGRQSDRERRDHLQPTQAQLIQSEKMASLGELTVGIVHEIQNPLNFCEINSGLFDELKKEINSGNQKEINTILNDLQENKNKIKHHGQRADAIVKSMLSHSRTNSGEKELTDINALSDEYFRLAYHGFRAKYPNFTPDLKYYPDPTLPKIHVVPQEISRVLLSRLIMLFRLVLRLRSAHRLRSVRMPSGVKALL